MSAVGRKAVGCILGRENNCLIEAGSRHGLDAGGMILVLPNLSVEAHAGRR